MNPPDPAESVVTTKSIKPFDDDSDFKITLGDYTWRVHADVVASKSGFFRRICDGNNWKESNERAVTLHDDNPVMFVRLLLFLYYDWYTYPRTDKMYCYEILAYRTQRFTGQSISIDKLLVSGYTGLSHDENNRSDLDLIRKSAIDLAVYELADKYDIPGLKEFALNNCHSNLDDELLSPISVMRDVFAQYYPDRMKQDPTLNEAFVRLVALNFDSLRADENEWTNGIGKWLKEDFEFCTMVMEKLSDFETLHGM